MFTVLLCFVPDLFVLIVNMLSAIYRLRSIVFSHFPSLPLDH
jgi:hypothetical protein